MREVRKTSSHILTRILLVEATLAAVVEIVKERMNDHYYLAIVKERM